MKTSPAEKLLKNKLFIMELLPLSLLYVMAIEIYRAAALMMFVDRRRMDQCERKVSNMCSNEKDITLLQALSNSQFNDVSGGGSL